jgi:hypothetical protein
LGALRRTLVFLAIAVVCASAAGTATAARKALWYDPKVDAVASDIAGVSVRVDGEDDWTEWAGFVAPEDPYAILGFTFPFEPPSSVLYHRIFITPDLWPTLSGAVETGIATSADLYKTGVAIFTMTHEAFHIRLVSGDEGRVNACALKAFPGVLQRDFGLAPTTTQTTSTPVTKRVRVKRRVWIRGHWVFRYRWVTKLTYQTTTTTGPNTTYDTLVADVQDFYTNHQPPPYNTGTCW